MKQTPVQTKSQPGFVILFTILISAIVLMIGFGIYSIATRETVLSSTAREAQFAFYAADAGVECALFAQSLPQGGPFPAQNSGLQGGGSFDCGDPSVTPNVSGLGTLLSPWVFDMLVDTAAGTCAHVTVFDTVGNSGPVRRVISQGYNVCDSAGLAVTSNPILVERTLDTTFTFGTGGTGGSGGSGGGTGIPLNPFDPSTAPDIEPSSPGGTGDVIGAPNTPGGG